VVVADGPRSLFRRELTSAQQEKATNHDNCDDELRFAGYSVRRGTVPESDLPGDVMECLRKQYPHFSNFLYFMWGPDASG
jgi:hypothetical protein